MSGVLNPRDPTETQNTLQPEGNYMHNIQSRKRAIHNPSIESSGMLLGWGASRGTSQIIYVFLFPFVSSV